MTLCNKTISFITTCLVVCSGHLFAQNHSYPIVDTGVKTYYSDKDIITEPQKGEAFFGQDAQYIGHEPSYTNNHDGIITDNVTGLVWAKAMDEKMTYEEAFKTAKASTLGGYSDWRVPTIKELYSLIIFTGQLSRHKGNNELFIDTKYFKQPLGDTSKGEREIDAQTWSATKYTGTTMRNASTVFGVNFIDGRIKGYPIFNRRKNKDNKLYVRLVRGNTLYGVNNFVNNHDGTITDQATGLMWQQADDGIARNWEEALSYAENASIADHTDWRLPNAKELQSIVDYTRSPQTTNSPAIDPLFETSEINYPSGSGGHFPHFWTSTTHLDGRNPYSSAVYVAFGEGLGKMHDKVMDVHGAGCQRSDPKSGNPKLYPQYQGPQGDIRYVFNHVRLVRDMALGDNSHGN
ncbi:Lcl C-terminal domain-containing protein [Carboxylicivirga marina]|uniref:DUF1566 domain-containing protein n=1 Tax=Carboxylicivirga marina TaxID=2800988 RepID=A0ABS1HDT3_9BACT|nr:DUF1566 domain-containing protein [Carboxylicivirga marina]MBK3515778.1 DUF1566 domain-containing protein [Carboxylicivirga marina]